MKRIRLAQRRRAVGLSQERLAELLGVDPSTIRRWERADNDPQPWHRPTLAQALRISLDELVLLLADLADGPTTARDLALGASRDQDEDVDRRSLLPLAALPALSGMGIVAELLTPVGGSVPMAGSDCTAAQAERLTKQAKTLYQDCQYQKALSRAPGLVTALGQLIATNDGVEQQRFQRLLADTYHVITSILLKLGDRVLATLAAQRSLDAASITADPVTAACSARIMTHALMNAGHIDRAVTLATAVGDQLRKSPAGTTPAGLSALGALALRAAIAAARADQRRTATELLSEADVAAVALGHDANDRWTAFGPTNVQLHKVHIALTLGDAGAALAQADRIDLTRKLAERKASFLSDVAQAHLARGRAAEALIALEQAYRVAPEEVASRSRGRRICNELLAASTRGPDRDRAYRFALQAGLLHG